MDNLLYTPTNIRMGGGWVGGGEQKSMDFWGLAIFIEVLGFIVGGVGGRL